MATSLPASRTQPRAAGRPRRAETDQLILDTASELLVENGYAGLSIEQVAAVSGVAKTTIYRRWSTKLELVFALMDRTFGSLPVVEGGAIADDLATLFKIVTAVAKGGRRQIVPALLAESIYNDELRAALQARHLLPRREVTTAPIEHAIARGELDKDVDPAVLHDLLAGFIWYRQWIIGDKLTPKEADKAIAILLHGSMAGRGRRRR